MKLTLEEMKEIYARNGAKIIHDHVAQSIADCINVAMERMYEAVLANMQHAMAALAQGQSRAPRGNVARVMCYCGAAVSGDTCEVCGRGNY